MVATTLPFERSGAYLGAIVLFALLGAPPYLLARRGWGGWKVNGVEIDFSTEACKALLLKADDVYSTIMTIMRNDKMYRGNRIEAVSKQAGE